MKNMTPTQDVRFIFKPYTAEEIAARIRRQAACIKSMFAANTSAMSRVKGAK